MSSARQGFLAVIRRFFESKFRKKSIVLRYDIITSPVNRRGLFFCPLHPKGNAAIFLPEIGGAGDLSMQKLLQFSQKTDFNLVMLMGNDNFKIRVLLSILVEDLL